MKRLVLVAAATLAVTANADARHYISDKQYQEYQQQQAQIQEYKQREALHRLGRILRGIGRAGQMASPPPMQTTQCQMLAGQMICHTW